MRASEFTVEYVNKKMLSPDWHASKTVTTKAGDIDLTARYYGAVADQIIITASIDGTKVGEVRFVVSTIDRPEPDLIAGNVNVDPEYRRQGIASAMYNWAKELGNDIAPSEMQTDYGRALWRDRKVWENFADGKKPGRKGLAKRVGVNCKQSVSKLRKIAANSSGERQRMAHWCANMKSGKRKTNEVDDNYYRPMTLPLGQYRGPYDPRTMMPYPGNFKDSLSLAEIVDELIYNGVKPQVITVDPKQLTATQDWLSDEGSNEPSFPEYADKPVALNWDNHLYLLDGHHRSAAALKKNRPITIYLFDVLDDDNS